jgi:hypothetical protein
VEWIQLAWERDQWQVLMNAVMNLFLLVLLVPKLDQ